jgi:hypothetical protein
MTVPESQRDSVVALLEAAAGRLEARGWRTHSFGFADGPNCMAGALLYESYGRLEDSAEHPYWTARRAMEGLLSCSLTYWNDHNCPDGTAAAEKLRLAAKEVAAGSL